MHETFDSENGYIADFIVDNVWQSENGRYLVGCVSDDGDFLEVSIDPSIYEIPEVGDKFEMLIPLVDKAEVAEEEEEEPIVYLYEVVTFSPGEGLKVSYYSATTHYYEDNVLRLFDEDGDECAVVYGMSSMSRFTRSRKSERCNCG